MAPSCELMEVIVHMMFGPFGWVSFSILTQVCTNLFAFVWAHFRTLLMATRWCLEGQLSVLFSVCYIKLTLLLPHLCTLAISACCPPLPLWECHHNWATQSHWTTLSFTTQKVTRNLLGIILLHTHLTHNHVQSLDRSIRTYDSAKSTKFRKKF